MRRESHPSIQKQLADDSDGDGNDAVYMHDDGYPYNVRFRLVSPNDRSLPKRRCKTECALGCSVNRPECDKEGGWAKIGSLAIQKAESGQLGIQSSLLV